MEVPQCISLITENLFCMVDAAVWKYLNLAEYKLVFVGTV